MQNHVISLSTADLQFPEMGSVLPSVGSIVSCHMSWTVTARSRTPGEHKQSVKCVVGEKSQHVQAELHQGTRFFQGSLSF